MAVKIMYCLSQGGFMYAEISNKNMMVLLVIALKILLAESARVIFIAMYEYFNYYNDKIRYTRYADLNIGSNEA